MTATRPDATRDDERTLALLKAHGRTATAFQVLAPGMRHWFADGARSDSARSENAQLRDAHAGDVQFGVVRADDPHAGDVRSDNTRGMVGYVDTGSAWVAAGEPVAARDDTIPVAEQFVDAAHARGKRVAFFATEGALASSPRFRRVLIGEQPVWNPMEWEATLRSSRSLREQMRRARAKGVTVRRVDADGTRSQSSAAGGADHEKESSATNTNDHELLRLMTRWLATRSMPSMHFLVELEPFVHRSERQLYVAERDGKTVAFLSLAPVSSRNGWLFEHLLRDPSAPNGTAELLVDSTMRTLGEQGVTWATLGLAPLAGEVSGWLRVARSVARPFFNFAGLAAFKRKLRPTSWEPIYLAYPRERSSVLAMRDGLRAFAGRSLIGFGALTVLRGPAPLLRALEWSLIPWTMALALWPANPWFPSPVVKWSWVAFDVLLIGALYQLRRKWNRRWAIGVATAVTLDTVVTLVQALMWNVSRTRTALELLMVVVACSGPALAAVVLWGSVRRRAVLEAE